MQMFEKALTSPFSSFVSEVSTNYGSNSAIFTQGDTAVT